MAYLWFGIEPQWRHEDDDGCPMSLMCHATLLRYSPGVDGKRRLTRSEWVILRVGYRIEEPVEHQAIGIIKDWWWERSVLPRLAGTSP